MNGTIPAALAALSLFVAGCGNMVKVTRVENGRKVTTWTTPEQAEQMKKDEQREKDVLAAYRTAEKRKAADPITVALYEPTVAANLEKAVKKDILDKQIRQHFENDPVIRLVSKKTLESAMKNRSFMDRDKPPSVAADVTVTLAVLAQDKVGVNRATGKAGMMKALVFRAEVISHYAAEDRRKVEKAGHFLQNVQTSKELAEEIKALIKGPIGKNIPSKAALRKIRGESVEQLDLGKVGDWLKSLKKKD